MMDTLDGSFKDLFDLFKIETEKVYSQYFEIAVSYLLNEYQRLIDQLIKNAESFLNVNLPSVTLEIPEKKGSRFYVCILPELVGVSVAGGSIINLLPRAWGDWFAKKSFLKQIDQFYMMQRARYLDDVMDRFEDQRGIVVSELINTTKKILQWIKESLQRGLALREISEAERQRAIKQLQMQEKALNVLNSKLNQLE